MTMLQSDLHDNTYTFEPGSEVQNSSEQYTLISIEIELVSAGIELIFFIVAGMVLCLGFVTKPVLITHPCFSYC